MGLSAYVPCNCWKEGVALPLPAEIPFDFICINKDGEVELRESKSEEKIDDSEFLLLFLLWKSHACTHESMRYISTHLGGYGITLDIGDFLDEYGWGKFPGLRKLLPEIPPSPTPYNFAEILLAEIENFCALHPNFENKLLLDELRRLFKASVATNNSVIWS